MLRQLPFRGATSVLSALLSLAQLALATPSTAQVLISKPVRLKDIAVIAGARPNALHGLGLVVGLEGTGDSQATGFSERALRNFVQGSGLFPTERLRSKNVAVVSVDAKLPPFFKPGQLIDVTVSSIGDAKSLANGMLISTPLKGPDDKVYAVAQGALSTGGFGIEVSGNQVKKNATLVARIPSGATIEREVPVTVLDVNGFLYLNLLNPDYVTASRMAAAIGRSYLGAAQALDAATIRVYVTSQFRDNLVDLVARLEALEVVPDAVAKVIIEERTGTVILGSMVKIDPVAISHGGLIIKVETKTNVSQPPPLSSGQTQVTQDSTVTAEEQRAKTVIFDKGTTLGQLVRSLNALGTTPRDLITILQNIKAAGALNAQLEII
ncbi:MAG: flagellar basal body P-ring protein FlgI [Cyanobacteria bacterium NC_groundwater_1444_Ag_S-0.65um_54_12]|nr:flagellar basal body P-ring protein FlgI [Cyanobacteria bacterium NC_groundwater_1444_Ag_S-0.65um_54_12]